MTSTMSRPSPLHSGSSCDSSTGSSSNNALTMLSAVVNGHRKSPETSSSTATNNTGNNYNVSNGNTVNTSTASPSSTTLSSALLFPSRRSSARATVNIPSSLGTSPISDSSHDIMMKRHVSHSTQSSNKATSSHHNHNHNDSNKHMLPTSTSHPNIAKTDQQ